MSPADILTVVDALLWAALRVAMAVAFIACLAYLVSASVAEIVRWRARR